MRRYVIIGFDYGPAHELFREVFNDEDVEFIRTPLKNPQRITTRILMKLLRYHLVPTFALSSMFSEFLSFDQSEEIVFIYSNPWIEAMMRSGFLDMLKEHYPNAYHAAYLLDIHAARRLDIENIKTSYDSTTIFNEEEAESLGVDYLPAMCSNKDELILSHDEVFDLSFTGQAKERYAELIQVYKKLTAGGLTCHFYIIGVPESEQYHAEGLFYGSELLTPEESLSYITSSKCLLEIQPYETSALTLRVQEAVIYDKKLLTNNPSISKFKYYKPNMIQIYEDADTIDLDFFKSKKDSYSYQGDYSPRVFLESIYAQCKVENTPG